MTQPLDFYATPGRLTNAGAMAALLNDLPTGVGELVRVVQGLMIHVFWAGRYGLALDEARQSEVQIRPLSAKLERIVELDPRPLTEPRDQFITGGRAWQLCRAGQADPEAFGIHDMSGLWFVRGNLVRDVAALNKMELLPWDSWGLVTVEGGDEALSAADLAALDEMAALSGGDAADFEGVQRRYETSDHWRVPPIITTFTPAGPVSVPL